MTRGLSDWLPIGPHRPVLAEVLAPNGDVVVRTLGEPQAYFGVDRNPPRVVLVDVRGRALNGVR